MESDWSDNSSSDSSVSALPPAIQLFLGSKVVRDYDMLNNGRERTILKDSGKAHVTYTGAQVSSKAMKL